jgi:peptidoglycan/xylan/chitin deacetylase (PgdA/CDA1 family)
LARVLKTAGLPYILERCTTKLTVLVVLTYHRIAEPGIRSNHYYDPIISATPESFEQQMLLFGKHFTPISIAEMRDLQALGVIASRTRKPLLLVTFDDGYRDNFDVALPILQKLGIPATFFIATRFLDCPQLPWWDHIAYVLKHTQTSQLLLKRSRNDLDPLRITVSRDVKNRLRTVAVAEIVKQFLNNGIEDELWFLGELEAQAGVSVNSQKLGRDLFMNWEQLSKLASSGFSVGSHGHHHLPLGRLDAQIQLHELRHSKERLESVLGSEIHIVAYPFGWLGTFTIDTQQLAAKAGYQFAFSSIEGVNYPESAHFMPFCLRRLNVGMGDSGLLVRSRALFHSAFGNSFL